MMKKKFFWVLIYTLCFAHVSTIFTKTIDSKHNRHHKGDKEKSNKCYEKIEGRLQSSIKQQFKRLECILNELKKCCNKKCERRDECRHGYYGHTAHSNNHDSHNNHHGSHCCR